MSKGYLPIVDPSEEFTEEVQPLSDFAADALDRKNGADKAGRKDGANDLPLEEGKEYSGTDVSPLTAAGEGLPKTEAIRTAYEKISYRDRLRKSIMSTTNTLIVVAAIAVLVAMLFLPVLRIYGQSMNATLVSGELVVSLKGAKFETGDVIAFYYNNNILVKRVIANSGEWVDIDLDGNVYVNQQKIDEPYLNEKAYGEPNIDFPYQVPDGRVFVLGDNRPVSVDSRNTSVGCVTSEQIVGKIVFRIWPLNRIGPIH